MGYALVFPGGGLGAMLRHGVNVGAGRLLGTAFPFATVLDERGDLILAALYVMVSVVCSIVGLFAGLWLLRQFA